MKEKFQFQYGAIKSPTLDADKHYYFEFQFQYGAIKSKATRFRAEQTSNI